MMTRANYQVLLSRENVQETVAVAECKAVFDLEVFVPGRTEHSPGRFREHARARQRQLDGRPIEIESPKGADHLSLVADQAGLCG